MAKPAPSGLNRFYLILGAIALAGAGAFWVLLQPKRVSIPANVVVQTADTAGFHGYLLGSPDAPVEVTEYSDFQCPACANFAIVQFPTIKERLIETGRVRWRHRDLPLNIHPHARTAAHAAACADEQGKFWEFKRGLYDTQQEWSGLANAAGFYHDLARSFGLDVKAYDACMASARYAGRIQASFDEGSRIGVPSTPSFVIGGRIYPAVMPYDEVKQIVDSLTAAQAAAPAAN